MSDDGERAAVTSVLAPRTSRRMWFVLLAPRRGGSAVLLSLVPGSEGLRDTRGRGPSGWEAAEEAWGPLGYSDHVQTGGARRGSPLVVDRSASSRAEVAEQHRATSP